MREPLEIVTASLMQDMLQIRQSNIYLMTKLLFKNLKKEKRGALGVESLQGGAMEIPRNNAP